jgi:hypothetical protein
VKTIEEIISRWRSAAQEKSQWHQHWEDLARVMLPRRMGFTSTTIEGERRTEDIYDGTPMQAARGLANAISGFMRPGGMPEVEMVADDDEANNSTEAQDWLADAKERMLSAFNNPKSRYRQVSAEFDLDLVVFGTAIEFVGENRNRNRLLFQSTHLKDATILFNDEGNADGMFHHRRSWSVRNLASRFGEKNLSERTQVILKNNPDQKIEVLNCVAPRSDFKKGAIFSRNMPYSDIWIELDAKHKIKESGYHEFPFVVARWDTSSGENYGRSPGMIALPDADTLQAMGETILIAGQRAADPPLFVPNDGAFNAANTFPGGISYYDLESAKSVGGNPFFPLESGTNLPVTRDMQSDSRDQIFAAFFRNVLNLPVEGPSMTATEVNVRKEEFIREIGPLFGRYESEKTAPEVERVFMLMLRGGAFLPIPKILQGKNINFQYASPVVKIRKQVEAATARMWAMEMIELGQVKQEAIDMVNVEALGRFGADALGIPKQIVNSPEMLQQMSQARAEQQAQASKMQMASGMVDVLGKGADIAAKFNGNAKQ